MKKVFITFTMLFMFAGLSFASGLDNKNAIGAYVLGADPTIGGLQYEHRFTDLVSSKIGAFVFYNNDTYSDPFNMNISLQTDFTLYENEWRDKIASRLFAYALAGYTANIERGYDYVNDVQKKEEFHQNAIASIGFGFDFIFFEHLSVPVQFGFMGSFPNDTRIGFCGGVGIRYAW